MAHSTSHFLILTCLLVLLATQVSAFGAGNIASISRIEGRNWRHGDIEDMLKTVVCLKGYKWTSMMIKRVYFGNWLRDYSQAVDIGTLKGVQADVIRILVWILGFMSFGYATGEFEVTAERLGVYRPEEHIDNPEGYGEGTDARQYDPRLRGPIMPDELAIDPHSGMKNYIANERGSWATSAGYLRFSFSRSIHFGRLFTNGAQGTRHRDNDLYEALRCLGQGLHCLEDFGAHTNYVELALREMGLRNVFPHVGSRAQVMLNGRDVYPLVTGTFGGVDFLHSVLGEATDHVTQSEVSEVDQLNKALQNASSTNSRGLDGSSDGCSELIGLLGKLPGTGDLCREAEDLQRDSNAQASMNSSQAPMFGAPPTQAMNPDSQAQSSSEGPMSAFDLQKTVAKIYPILEFRDKVVRTISGVVEKIPGLEKLIETISEKVTLFVMGLLAPYIIPIINTATKQLKMGSTTVVGASANQQYAVWDNPASTAPTHSLLSKDHFSNILNEPAGQVASSVLQYAAPRVIYAWENPGVPVDQVLDDILQIFHHPANRNERSEIHRTMFSCVERWMTDKRSKGTDLEHLLSSESVRKGKNHITPQGPGVASEFTNFQSSSIFGMGSHSKVNGNVFDMMSGGGRRGLDDDDRGLGSSGVPDYSGSGAGEDWRQAQEGYGSQPGYQGESSGYGQDYGGQYEQSHQQPAPDYYNNQGYGTSGQGAYGYGQGGPEYGSQQRYGRGR